MSQQSLQDEWTIYTAWPSFISGYANRDTLRNCFDTSTTFEQNLCDKENLSAILPRKTPSNKSCPCIIAAQAGGIFHNKCDIDIGNTKLNMQQTAPLWNSILENCHVEKITCWKNSLEYRNFLKSFAISYKAKLNIKKTFTWNFKCYGCHGKKLEKWNLRNSCQDDQLNELTDDSEDECSSQCCGQKFYISEHGVVFSNQEEKQIFDEKMAKMDELLKSELNTIREQHNRLQQIVIKGENYEDIINSSRNEEILDALDESSIKGDEVDGTEMYDLNFIEEDQERTKPSIFDNFIGLLNNINMPWDISDRVPGRNVQHKEY